MATAVANYPPISARSASPRPHLSLNAPAAIPNKHIPTCPPGALPATPPATPSRRRERWSSLSSSSSSSSMVPPFDIHSHGSPCSHDPPVYLISASQMAQAIDHLAAQPLPSPNQVFPWLHGLHAANQLQLTFFSSSRTSSRRVPRCLRGLTIVKTGGNLSTSRLKGALAPAELLAPADGDALPTFIDCDPHDGFSVRNFHIQACKLATVSDIVVYADHKAHPDHTLALAQRLSHAQRQFEVKNGLPRCLFNTFVLSDSFASVQEHHAHLVAIDARGDMTGTVVDFVYWERYEMSIMSEASEISNNVFLGPTPDVHLYPSCGTEDGYDMLVETTDGARVPEPRSLRALRMGLEKCQRKGPLHMQFPSSGSIMAPSWSHAQVDGLMEMCKWMYDLANPHEAKRLKRGREEDDEAIAMDDMATPRKFLLHCTDGYTETTLLALTYFMYAEGLPLHEAWIHLHRAKRRDLFAYPTDVALLRAIQPRILQESPSFKQSIFHMQEPHWLSHFDGSLPSRILSHMYLGNIGHANNPHLLQALGISRVLSVGESLSWLDESREKLGWPSENLLTVDRVQDNGIDPLWSEFERCLQFIEAGKTEGGATLVHCRVGVSRSATICIAHVMSELELSFARAYCFVRARRLNVIIQPHLRFAYELLKWEEYLRQQRNQPPYRELEWATIAREIASMNKPYSR